jgi:hypothetical protein
MKGSVVHIPVTTALRMISDYAGRRIREQLRAVAFIVIYLLAFQMLLFGTAPQNAIQLAGGIGLVVLGLALFLEGLLLGLMPLSERVGIQLPLHGGALIIVPFGLLLGLGATLAEPAVASLRLAGRGITPWEAPLLFYLLEQNPQQLVFAIGAGVGVAVAIGMLRFYIGFSIKPVIMITIPLLLAGTLVFSWSEALSTILGLAWDAGAVTTGAVTVPLVLALGIGVSRSSGKDQGGSSSFGLVMLASALPVLGVMVLGFIVAPSLPDSMSEEAFFAAENREQVLVLFQDESHLEAYEEKHNGAAIKPGGLSEPTPAGKDSVLMVLFQEASPAARAVLPLTLLLGAVLFLLFRDRPRYLDEVFLGIIFALIGMILLTAGIRIGLSPLGDEVGRRLPQIYRETDVDSRIMMIKEFRPDMVFTAVDEDGDRSQYFYIQRGDSLHPVEFLPERYDSDASVYAHHISTSPLVHPELTRVGILLILLFAFGMGYGSTLAEPALSALGRTVEELTVGTVTRSAVVRAVSIGVGIGLIAGVIRILYDVPMVWMLLPPYLLLLPLTLLSEESFVGIAWDSGGVTTGTITVPLVLAMGLGLGGEMGVVDGFGILAMASVYPILSVLLFGVIVRMRQRRIVRAARRGGDNHA